MSMGKVIASLVVRHLKLPLKLDFLENGRTQFENIAGDNVSGHALSDGVVKYHRWIWSEKLLYLLKTYSLWS